MYQNKIMLSPRDILQKEFKIDTRGYRLKEVDQFLDTIISDYDKKVIVENVAVTTPWEFLYEGTLSLGDWSQTFIEAPNVQLTNGSGSGFLIESFVSPGGSTTTSVGSIYIVRPNSATINVHINVLGIGKWK